MISARLFKSQLPAVMSELETLLILDVQISM